MSNTIRIKRRASGGASGSPSSLINGELAYNESDNTLYYGYGDDGLGNATSIPAIAGSGSFVTLNTNQTVGGTKTFSNTIVGSITGNAGTATALATPRTIAGQSFDGTANILIEPTDLTGVTVTASELNILDGATLTTTELNYVDGVTSSIQDQLDSKSSSTHNHTLDSLSNTTITSNTAGEILKWNGTAWVNNTLAEAGIAPTTHDHVVSDITDLTATATELNILDGATLTTTELNYVDGVTSSIQTQLNTKAPISSPSFTDSVTIDSGRLYGPSTFYIDPATHDDNTGTVIIAGNLQVDGTTTTINSTVVAVDDLAIVVADGQTDANTAAANGAGIIVGTAGVNQVTEFVYDDATTSWKTDIGLTINGELDGAIIDGGTF